MADRDEKGLFLPGNKVGVNSTTGRPPSLCTDEECEILGKDLVEWIKTQREQTHFIEWYYDRHGMFRDDWKALVQRAVFLPFYKVARQLMTAQMMKSKMHPSYINRYIAMYDDELRDEEKSIRDEKNAVVEKVLDLVDLKHSVERGDYTQKS